jgi:superfamily II DNA or RNA helicase
VLFEKYEKLGLQPVQIVRTLDAHGFEEGEALERSLDSLAPPSKHEAPLSACPSPAVSSSSKVASTMDDEVLGTEEEEDEEGKSEGACCGGGIDEILGLEAVSALVDVDEPVEGRRAASTYDSMRYLVRPKGCSYCHVRWVKKETILRDAGGNTRLKAFMIRQAQERPLDDGEYFPAEVFLVERVLADRGSGRYLVKWCGLPYKMATVENLLTDPAILRNQNGGVEAMEALVRDWEKRTAPVAEKELKAIRTAAERVKARKAVGEAGFSLALDLGALRSIKDYQLRSYQVEGIKWLTFNWANKRNIILADEMGLGKTAQTAVFLQEALTGQSARSIGPALIVVPLSTSSHWARELSEWTSLRAICLSGDKQSRSLFFEHDWRRGKKRDGQVQFDVLVTTYEVLRQEVDRLQGISWSALVIDEAHRIKSVNSMLKEDLLKLKVDYRLLLTGTFIQNDVAELWSLFNFMHPERFDCLEEWMDKFGITRTSGQLSSLTEAIRPYVLRRMKADVTKDLKPLKETLVFVEMVPFQRHCYRALYEKNAALLLQGQDSRDSPSFSNLSMQLRKCCNHPFMLDGVEEAEMASSGLALDTDPSAFMAYSGKLLLLQKLLPRLREQGERCLIFSQFTVMLDYLEDALRAMEYGYERLDGSVRGDARQASIDRFNGVTGTVADRKLPFVFLLSTRAGGVGINLQSASTVIIFDSDWNPQMDVQAQARCHRLGQDKDVKVYRLITARTYEAELFKRASLKLGLERAINSGIVGSAKPAKKELEELLQQGAYGAFAEDGDNEACRQFCEADIDTIMSKYADTFEHDAEAQKSGAFSVARFVSSAEEGDGAANALTAALEAAAKREADLASFEAEGDLKSRKDRACRQQWAPSSEGHARRSGSGQTPPPRMSVDGDLDELDDDSDEDDKGIEAPPGSKRAKTERGAGHLTLAECRRLEKAFSQFGLGRWTEVRAASGLGATEPPGNADATVTSFAALMLNAAANAALAQADSAAVTLALASLFPRVQPSGNSAELPVDCSTMEGMQAVLTALGGCIPKSAQAWLVKRMEKRGERLLHRWLLLDCLHRSVSGDVAAFSAPPCKAQVSGAPYWFDDSSRLDTGLLLAVHRHGWPIGNGAAAVAHFDVICNDGDFPFAGTLAAASGPVAEEDRDANLQAQVRDTDVVTASVSLGASSNLNEAAIDVSISEAERKAALELIVSDDEEDKVPVGTELTPLPRQWPQPAALQGRVKRLLAALLVRERRALAKAAHEESSGEKERKSQARRLVKEAHMERKAALQRAREAQKLRDSLKWAPKSCSELWTVFRDHSPPLLEHLPVAAEQWLDAFDWGAFMESTNKPGLSSKSPESARDFVEALCRHCGLLDGLVDHPSSEAVQEIGCLLRELERSEEGDYSGSSQKAGASQSFSPGAVVAAQLQELLRVRIPVAWGLLRVLELGEEAVAEGVVKAKGFPSWWNASCDLDLCRGVRKHGLGGKCFKAIAKDPQLLFLKKDTFPKQQQLTKRLLELMCLSS